MDRLLDDRDRFERAKLQRNLYMRSKCVRVHVPSGTFYSFQVTRVYRRVYISQRERERERIFTGLDTRATFKSHFRVGKIFLLTYFRLPLCGTRYLAIAREIAPNSRMDISQSGFSLRSAAL